MLNEKSRAGQAVVIGAGVMGAGIAAHLANIGWRVHLLDRASDEGSRNRIAQEGLERALKARPPQFALPERAGRVRVGNMEDDLDALQDADWVVEAVVEEMAVKKAVLAQVAAHVGPQTVVSSNTSGLSLAGMSANCPKAFRARFLGTHFFNPPRTMKPVELIPTDHTDPDLFEGFVRFAERVLGKRVIRAKDTPGFISTRLGMCALAKTIERAAARGLTVEETDYLTGPLLGRPRSGTFRLADIVGLDILARILDNLAADLPADRYVQSLRLPDVVRRLIAEGRIGAKAGAGFYRREADGSILSLDLSTLEYRPRQEPVRFPPEVENLPLDERLRRLWALSPDHDGGFLQEMLRATLGYVADVTPEVADRIVEVDDALMGGFGWERGPFQMLDALGAMEWPDGEPRLVTRLRETGQERFYFHEAGKRFFFDFRTGKIAALPRPEGVLVLTDLKEAGRIVEEIEDASLVSLRDEALCLEWRTKMNVLNPQIVAFMVRARERAERDFAALVLGGSGEHFSAGFDLNRFAARIEAEDWNGIDAMVRLFQQALLGFKYAKVPVVCAAYGYTLGGGCETMLHCLATQADFEARIGLPEANVGLIPAGGGTTQMLLRAMAFVPPSTPLERADPYPALRPVWDTMRQARFSSCADEARLLGYLRPSDGVTLHPDRLLHDAKARALALAADYRPPASPIVTVMGEEGLARFRWEIHLLRRAEQITAHDARIADRLAFVLCGGGLIHPTDVSEPYLLDLEREAFLSLCGTSETLARIRHLLETGRPLRN